MLAVKPLIAAGSVTYLINKSGLDEYLPLGFSSDAEDGDQLVVRDDLVGYSFK
jgi:hypothetical protein